MSTTVIKKQNVKVRTEASLVPVKMALLEMAFHASTSLIVSTASGQKSEILKI